MFDAITVGGGLAGLQLSSLLAKDGMKTLVLEKNARLGGRAFILERDGFVLDNGVHLIRFGPESAPAKVMRYIGKKINFVDLGTSYVLDKDGEVKIFPTKPLTFLKSKIFTFRDTLTALRTMIKLRKGNFDNLLEKSVKEWMDENGFEGGLRRYFHLVSASMLVCPFTEKASVGELLRNIQKVLKRKISVMYPQGGWKPMFDAWQDVIKKNGEIRTNSPVKNIVVENGKAKGVKLENGEIIQSKIVVISIPVQQLFSILDESLVPSDFVNLCKNLKPTAGISIDYCLNKKISEDKGLWYIYEPMSFGLFTSNLEPSLAPSNKQILTFFYPRPVEEMEDKELRERRAEELEKAINSLFPGINENLHWKRISFLKMVDGVEVNVHQHRKKRPGFKVPGIENIYLVGDSTAGDGAGGDVGHESVIECYSEITGKRI